MSFVEELLKKKVLVFVGAGGVGKTTSSVIAALTAAKAGKKVAVLSIDPAKRLAKALGIELGNSLSTVKLPENYSGSLVATMLDQKSIFDNMVKKHAPNANVADKILENPFYVSLCSNFDGAGEYMAIAKLQELVESNEYDLIVVDTPPDTHALDFLKLPNILDNYINNKVITWVLKPMLTANKFGFGKIMAASEKLLGGLTRITGVDSLTVLADFLILMQEVMEGFQKAGNQVIETLKLPSTGFMIVTVPTASAQRSFKVLLEMLHELGHNCEFTIINRGLDSSMLEKMAEVPKDDASTSPQFEDLKERCTGERLIEQGVRNHLAKQNKASYLLRVPEQSTDLHELDQLDNMISVWQHASDLSATE